MTSPVSGSPMAGATPTRHPCATPPARQATGSLSPAARQRQPVSHAEPPLAPDAGLRFAAVDPGPALAALLLAGLLASHPSVLVTVNVYVKAVLLLALLAIWIWHGRIR